MFLEPNIVAGTTFFFKFKSKMETSLQSLILLDQLFLRKSFTKNSFYIFLILWIAILGFLIFVWNLVLSEMVPPSRR